MDIGGLAIYVPKPPGLAQLLNARISILGKYGPSTEDDRYDLRQQ